MMIGVCDCARSASDLLQQFLQLAAGFAVRLVVKIVQRDRKPQHVK